MAPVLATPLATKLVFKLFFQPTRNSVLPGVIKGWFSRVPRVYLQRMLGYVIDKSLRNSCGSRGAVSANKNVVAFPSVYLGNQSFLALRKIINKEINDSAVMVNNRFIRTFLFEKISWLEYVGCLWISGQKFKMADEFTNKTTLINLFLKVEGATTVESFLGLMVCWKYRG